MLLFFYIVRSVNVGTGMLEFSMMALNPFINLSYVARYETDV